MQSFAITLLSMHRFVICRKKFGEKSSKNKKTNLTIQNRFFYYHLEFNGEFLGDYFFNLLN